ncbi:MAG: ribonuclease HII [Alphaproteobacteria bacterium]|nr:ribonuclease HII [Alphaproteobacteria bacterium]
MPDFSLESIHPFPVAGIDEVGRGPWAGPVLACALMFLTQDIDPTLRLCLDDSKKLTPKKRDAAFNLLQESAHKKTLLYACGLSTVEEIDRLNIHSATLLAMTRAVEGLPLRPAFLLVDGLFVPPCGVPGKAVVKGDSASLSIAAASIVAKVLRDRLMTELAKDHPAYAWERNAGYGTKAHQEGLRLSGVTPHHRRSFAPIKALLKAA